MSDSLSTPKVSILIPVHNVEKYVERCILSVLGQTMQEGVEVIILNDCTPDRSMEIIQSVLQTHLKKSRIAVRIIEHERNRGQAAARNTLISHAKGEYILFIDSDDYIDSNMLEKMYSKAVETGADIVMVDVMLEYSNEQRIHKAPFYTEKEKVLRCIIRGENSYLWNKLTRRSLYTDNDISFTEEMDVSEDYGVIVPLCYIANKIEHASSVFYHYIQYNTLSITKRNITQKKIDGWLYHVRKIEELLIEKEIKGYDLDITYQKLEIRVQCMKRTTGRMQQEYSHLSPEITLYKWKLLRFFPGRTYKILMFLALFGYPRLFNFLLKTTSLLGKKY